MEYFAKHVLPPPLGVVGFLRPDRHIPRSAKVNFELILLYVFIVSIMRADGVGVDVGVG